MQPSLQMLAPWWVKIPAKIVLARLPVPYALWRRLNVFKHGFMTDPAYAEGVFLKHFAELDVARRREFTCLELGPGDSLLSALIARKHGAARTWLVDVGDFATRDPEVYRTAATALLGPGHGATPPWNTVEEMLAECGGSYHTDGVASLRAIPAGSVDFVWSQAVLEHVRREDFLPLLQEIRRVLKPGGVASHRVDLKDHLGGRLNNLRFRDELWEGPLFSSSGFYTNRFRYSEILGMCKEAGLEVRSARPDLWDTVPTPRRAMAARFRQFADDDLRVQGFFLSLVRP